MESQNSSMRASKPVARSLLTSRYEIEVFSCGSEAKESLHKWETCTKNSGHPNFIPAPKFGLEYLPHLFQEERFLKAVRCLCNLTVRVRVGNTVTPREGGQVGGPQTGTGRIVDISLSESPCSCMVCRKEGSNSDLCWNLDIVTALHVVDNTEEARLTRVDLFYDDVDSFTNGTARTVCGTKVLYRDIGSDTCVFRCAVHDESLQKVICSEQTLLDALHLVPKFFDNNLVVVVSHPHGQPKQVTVGEMTRTLVARERVKNDQPAYLNFETYTKQYFPCQASNIIHNANTCPGSSGAPILWLGYSFGLLGYRKMLTTLKYYVVIALLLLLIGQAIYRPDLVKREELLNTLLVAVVSFPLSFVVVFCWRKIRKLVDYPPVTTMIAIQYVERLKGDPFKIIPAHILGYATGMCHFDIELALLLIPVRALLNFFLTPIIPLPSFTINFWVLSICSVHLQNVSTSKLSDKIWAPINVCVPYILLSVWLNFMWESVSSFILGMLMAFVFGFKMRSLFCQILPIHQVTFDSDKVSEIEVNPIAVHTGVSLSGSGNEGYCYIPVVYNYWPRFSKRFAPKYQDLTKTSLRQKRYDRVCDKVSRRNALLTQNLSQVFHSRPKTNGRLEYISWNSDTNSNKKVLDKID